MRVITSLFVVTFLLISFTTFAENEKVNFSGEWSLNEEKSELGEGRRRMPSAKLTISQEDDTLTIERLLKRRSGEEFKVKEKFTLDGKECENTVYERPKKSVATWSKDGKSLNITSKIVFERDGNEFEFNTVEIWKLADEGNSLSIEYTSKSTRGERKRTYVYDKVKVNK